MSRTLTIEEIAKIDFINDERFKIHDSDSDDIKQKKRELMTMQRILIEKQRRLEEMKRAQRECQLEIQRLDQEDYRLSEMLHWTEMEIQWNKEHPNAIDYIP